MGLKEKSKVVLEKIVTATKPNPREEAEKITEGKIPEKHLGKHTIETTGQIIFSLENTRPMFRDKKWKESAKLIRKVCMNRISHGDPHYQNLLRKLDQVELMR